MPRDAMLTYLANFETTTSNLSDVSMIGTSTLRVVAMSTDKMFHACHTKGRGASWKVGGGQRGCFKRARFAKRERALDGRLRLYFGASGNRDNYM